MPTPTEMLWQAITDKNPEKAIEIIKLYPQDNLLNAVMMTDPDPQLNGNSLLMEVVCNSNRFMPLIHFILTHKEFDITYTNPRTKKTTFDYILLATKANILKLVINIPVMLKNGTIFTYQVIDTKLKTSTKTYNEYIANNEGPKKIAIVQDKIENLQKMKVMTRDATIIEAARTDNPLLLEELQNAGDDLSVALENGQLPSRLVTEETPKLRAFFFASMKKISASEPTTRPSESLGFISSINALKNRESELNSLTASSVKKTNAVHINSINARTELLDTIKNSF